jgi:PIN domain nuclease of toxin-antitoxin system
MTQKQRYLLDTHAAVWLQLEPKRLGARARQVLSGAAPNELYISEGV